MGRNKKRYLDRNDESESVLKNNMDDQELQISGGYRVIERTHHNQKFIDYYKHLNLLEDNKWDLFYAKLKEPLPTCFRVVTGTLYTSYILKVIEQKIAAVPDIIRRIEGYPGYVYEINASRSQLRKDEALKDFHDFLVRQSEIGTVFRQELVSMIPALFMPVDNGSRILDLCAAPGSKTAQLLEALQPQESGLIVANDACCKRAHMLIHRLKHLNTLSFLVTSHEAQTFPNIFIPTGQNQMSKLRFSCILCDVPCSSDGTLRKSAIMWRRWDSQRGLFLHRIQVSILTRALQLCEVGGTVVYSTCSFNPIENEAVVNSTLSFSPSSFALQDCEEKLRDLPHKSGITNWAVFYKNHWYETFEETSSHREARSVLLASMFPYCRSHREDLKKCIRFYPHLYNTGGFFVAVIKKIAEIREEKVCTLKSQEKQHIGSSETIHPSLSSTENIMTKVTETENVQLDQNEKQDHSAVLKKQTDFLSFEQYFQEYSTFERRQEFWGQLGGMYGFEHPDSSLWKRLLIRTLSVDAPRKIWIVSREVSDVIHALFRIPLKILSAGCLLFDGKHSKEFRITCLGARVLYQEKTFLKKDQENNKAHLVAKISLELMRFLLTPKPLIDSEALKDKQTPSDSLYRHNLDSLQSFSGYNEILRIPPNMPCLLALETSRASEQIRIPMWRGTSNVQVLLNSHCCIALLDLLNFCTLEYQNAVRVMNLL